LKEVHSSSISAANTEIATVLQPSAAAVKVVRGTYLKISAEKKAEIGQRAAEATKLPVRYTCMRPADRKLIKKVGVAYLSNAPHSRNYSNKIFKNSYLRENLDTRNISLVPRPHLWRSHEESSL